MRNNGDVPAQPGKRHPRHLSKVESGRLSLEHAGFDLVELAEDVMETLGVRAHEKGLELALRIPSTLSTGLMAIRCACGRFLSTC